MGTTKQGAEYTPLPADFQKQRNDIWSYLGGDIGKETPGYKGDLGAPGQLKLAGDFITKLLGGGGTGLGGMQMPAGWGNLGAPVSTDPAYQADLARTKMNVGSGVDAALQQAFGTGGSTQGTGMMRVAGDVASRGYTDLAANEMERQRQTLEAAKQRQQWMAGTEMDEAARRAGLGMAYTGAYQTAQTPAYEEWKRRQYMNSPLFAGLMNWGSQYPQNPQVPDTVESPWMGLLRSLLQGAGTVAGAAVGKP